MYKVKLKENYRTFMGVPVRKFPDNQLSNASPKLHLDFIKFSEL